jgi:hypothetical protein
MINAKAVARKLTFKQAWIQACTKLKRRTTSGFVVLLSKILLLLHLDYFNFLTKNLMQEVISYNHQNNYYY